MIGFASRKPVIVKARAEFDGQTFPKTRQPLSIARRLLLTPSVNQRSRFLPRDLSWRRAISLQHLRSAFKYWRTTRSVGRSHRVTFFFPLFLPLTRVVAVPAPLLASTTVTLSMNLAILHSS